MPDAKAIYDYDATDDDELTIAEGDTISLVHHEGDWYEGTNKRTGLSGQFPAAYVELVDGTADAAEDAGRDAAEGGAEGAGSGNAPGDVVRASFDYDATDADEISLKDGEAVTLIACEGDWWEGTNESGETGMFPAAYVQPSSADNSAAAKKKKKKKKKKDRDSKRISKSLDAVGDEAGGADDGADAAAKKKKKKKKKDRESKRLSSAPEDSELAALPEEEAVVAPTADADADAAAKKKKKKKKKDRESKRVEDAAAAAAAAASGPPSLPGRKPRLDRSLSPEAGGAARGAPPPLPRHAAPAAAGGDAGAPPALAPRRALPQIVASASSAAAEEEEDASAPEPSLGTATVLFDYDAEDGDEISIVEGDVVTITARDGDWWSGRNARTGQSGTFPATYVGDAPPPQLAPTPTPASADTPPPLRARPVVAARAPRLASMRFAAPRQCVWKKGARSRLQRVTFRANSAHNMTRPPSLASLTMDQKLPSSTSCWIHTRQRGASACRRPACRALPRRSTS